MDKQLTVKKICEMIQQGQLHYNQSTQRNFVYANMSAQLPGGVTTKSGSLLNSMLEKNIQLPAVYFWKNTDTNQLNIHDGKQRLLSIYYFIYPTSNINISTILNGKTFVYDGLPEDMKQKLLNYTFDIVYREGTSLEEEESFEIKSLKRGTPYIMAYGIKYELTEEEINHLRMMQKVTSVSL